MKSTKILGLAAALVLLGCDDPLVEREIVVDTRVIAAVASVDGDSGRATPRVGETVTVELTVLGPEPRARFGWSIAACAETSDVAAARCAGTALATASAAPALDVPRLSVVVPDVPGFTFVGTVCDGATPDDAGCPPDARSTDWRLDVAVANEGSPENRHPALGADALRVDAAPLAPSGGCDLRVAPSTRHRLGIELLPTALRDGEIDERWLVSWFTTAGALSSAFSTLDGAAPRAGVDFDAPDAAGRLGLAVVARDLRGGVTPRVLAVCVEQ